MRKEIRKMELESPGPGFSSRVMEAIRMEGQPKPVIKKEPVLGTIFWGVAGLFIIFLVVVLLQGGMAQAQAYQPHGELLSGVRENVVESIGRFTEGFRRALGGLPLYIAAVFMAVTSLLAAEHLFLSGKQTGTQNGQ